MARASLFLTKEGTETNELKNQSVGCWAKLPWSRRFSKGLHGILLGQLRQNFLRKYKRMQILRSGYGPNDRAPVLRSVGPLGGV